MKTTHLLLLATALIATLSCQQASEQGYSENKQDKPLKMEQPVSSGSGGSDLFSSEATRWMGGDSTRQFLRTIRMKFRAGSVYKSTLALEKTAVDLGGFVTLSDIVSGGQRTEKVAVSEDSTLETTYYTLQGHLELRVPSERLDSMLKYVAQEVAFLDYRTIAAEDVSLALKANEWKERRYDKQARKLEAKKDQSADATIRLELGTTNYYDNDNGNYADALEKKDEARLENISLKDRVRYSLVIMDIYEREAYSRELIPNKSNIAAFEPSFGYRLVKALSNGWDLFLGLLLFLARIWWLLALALIAYGLYRRFKS